MGPLNNSRHMANTCHMSDQAHHARECSKYPNLSEGFVQSGLNEVERNAAGGPSTRTGFFDIPFEDLKRKGLQGKIERQIVMAI